MRPAGCWLRSSGGLGGSFSSTPSDRRKWTVACRGSVQRERSGSTDLAPGLDMQPRAMGGHPGGAHGLHSLRCAPGVSPAPPPCMSCLFPATPVPQEGGSSQGPTKPRHSSGHSIPNTSDCPASTRCPSYFVRLHSNSAGHWGHTAQAEGLKRCGQWPCHLSPWLMPVLPLALSSLTTGLCSSCCHVPAHGQGLALGRRLADTQRINQCVLCPGLPPSPQKK